MGLVYYIGSIGGSLGIGDPTFLPGRHCIGYSWISGYGPVQSISLPQGE